MRPPQTHFSTFPLHSSGCKVGPLISQGHPVMNYTESIMIVKWKDKHTVIYIPSQFDFKTAKTTNKKEFIPKPYYYVMSTIMKWRYWIRKCSIVHMIETPSDNIKKYSTINHGECILFFKISIISMLT